MMIWKKVKFKVLMGIWNKVKLKVQMRIPAIPTFITLKMSYQNLHLKSPTFIIVLRMRV